MKHTKKQIQEAISYWECRLEKLNESTENDPAKAFQEIITAAKDLGIDVPFQTNASESEDLDESGVLKGAAIYMAAAMLGICAIGKITNNISEGFKHAPKDAGNEIVEDVGVELAHIKECLEKMEEKLNSYKEQDPAGKPGTKAVQALHQEFNEIMKN